MSDAAWWFMMLAGVCWVLALCPKTARGGPGIAAGRNESEQAKIKEGTL